MQAECTAGAVEEVGCSKRTPAPRTTSPPPPPPRRRAISTA